MRIAELSRRTGVSSATIKYYTREGMLPAGERTGYNQTEYDDDHAARLRLIRALVEVGGLSIASTKAVLSAIENDAVRPQDVLGIAQKLIPTAPVEPSAEALERVRATMRLVGWQTFDDNPGIPLTARVVDAQLALGRADLVDAMDRYAPAVQQIAEVDLGVVAAVAGRAEMADTVVLGTVLGDAMLQGMRRIADESLTHRMMQNPIPEDRKEPRQ